MATVLVKLEPLDIPNDSQAELSTAYDVIDVKPEVFESVESADEGSVHKLEIKEESDPESKQELVSVQHRESPVDEREVETQQPSGRKRPRLSVNEDSLVRMNGVRSESESRHLERPMRVSRAQNPAAEPPQHMDDSHPPPAPDCLMRISSRCRENRSDSGTQVTEDSLKMFFDAMYHDTKALPLHLQIRTKRLLFQAVADGQDMAGMSRPPIHDRDDRNHSSTSRRVSSSGQMSDFNNPRC